MCAVVVPLIKGSPVAMQYSAVGESDACYVNSATLVLPTHTNPFGRPCWRAYGLSCLVYNTSNNQIWRFINGFNRSRDLATQINVLIAGF